MLPRYTLKFQLVEVDPKGQPVRTSAEWTLDEASTDKEGIDFAMGLTYGAAQDYWSQHVADVSPVVPDDWPPVGEARYHQGDGEDMLRRMEDAGGDRFATGLYGDYYGFGDEPNDDPMDANYGREYDDDEQAESDKYDAEEPGASLYAADRAALNAIRRAGGAEG